ncbi:hypothetical protein D3C87_1722330 [compost metagenome]|uniref:hypothetical protein n=1 Tax=Agrobacterium tumefaciens TaxID=358 RepID=UPI000F9FEC84
MPYGPIDARRVPLLSAVQDTGAKSFKYLYDFGDGYDHDLASVEHKPVSVLDQFFDWEMPTLTGLTAEEFGTVAGKLPRE